jgi:hypothetical protein
LLNLKGIRLDPSPVDRKRAKKFISFLEKSGAKFMVP